jgi:exopolysaccharide biosynthesis polyprenyl glycosylphosphotransferase
VADQIGRHSTSGYTLLGAYTLGSKPETPLPSRVDDLVVDHDAEQPVDVAMRLGADTLVFTGSESMTPRETREMGWNAEHAEIDMVVAPALTDVAGPRIHTTPVAGLPLVHIDYPGLDPAKSFTKRLLDVLVSGTLLVALIPLWLVLALVIRADSPGGVIYRQERIGLNGRRFKMLKFRSMLADADKQLPSLLDRSDGNGVLFKMKDDPRVTKVGGFLRRHSLDELPQLWNVLRGEMALVGPRPPIEAEVEQYDEWAMRRLMVKPGITGLWQTSGRSNLSWDESVRMDLYYVDNWSVMGDLVLLFRTIKAVLKPEGAY